MKQAVFFNTLNGHSFLYSPFRNQVLLCHPVISRLHDLEVSGINLSEFIQTSKNDGNPVIFENFQVSHAELVVHWKKYRFLKQHDFFKVPRQVNLNGRLQPSRVETDLTRVQQVIFETTEECNLSCTYCTYSKFYINQERGKKKFSIAAAKRALDHLMSVRDKASTHLIVSFYGGEPFRNFAFIRDVVAYLKESYGDRQTFKFNLTTNGLLLSKHTDYLVANDFDVSVSLDGDETGNSFRILKGELPTHAIVLRHLDLLRERYPDYFERNISFLAVLHNRNSYQEVVDYFKKRFGKTPITSMISTTNINEVHKKEFSTTFLSGMRNTFHHKKDMLGLFMEHPTVKELANTLEKYTGIIFKNHFQIMSRINGNEVSRAFVPTATCLPFSLRVYLTADGSVLPCEHISRDFKLGNLHNREVHLDSRSIADLFNRNFDKIRSLCERCYLADNCKECVFNTRTDLENPVCDFFMDEQHFRELLEKMFNLVENDYTLYSKLLKEAFHAN